MDRIVDVSSQPVKPEDKALAQYIRNTADALGIKQYELADLTGITRDSFGDYWRGTKTMSFANWRATIRALGQDYTTAMDEVDRIYAANQRLADEG